MHLLSALGPAGPAPSAALLARFDRVVPRNLALPPLETFARSLSAADLGEALARRGRPVGPARDMPVHLLVGLPCDACLGGDRTLAAIVREVRGLAEALGTPQDVARVTFQACDGMTMGDRRLGIVLDAVRTRVELATLHPAQNRACMALGFDLGLSVYDASYLWLAMSLKLPLLTHDKQLAAAAARQSVKVLTVESF